MFVWLVGPVEKFCLNWFASGVMDGTCYVCTYFTASQNTMTTDFSLKLYQKSCFLAVKIFPSREIGVFAAVTNHFFQFMLPLVILLFIYAHIAVVLFKKSRKNTLTEVVHFFIIAETLICPIKHCNNKNTFYKWSRGKKLPLISSDILEIEF